MNYLEISNKQLMSMFYLYVEEEMPEDILVKLIIKLLKEYKERADCTGYDRLEEIENVVMKLRNAKSQNFI